MPNLDLPQLPLHEWQPTRDTLHQYAKVAGGVRRTLMPTQKHWWHVSLRATATGVTTTPMPASRGTVEILLDLVEHALVIRSSLGDMRSTPLQGQSPLVFCDTVMEQLAQLGAAAELDRSEFGRDHGVYDRAAVGRYWQASSAIDMLLKQFRSEQRRETSPVQLWPHHFDWALSWFSGRHVPGVDIDDAGNSDETMTFGFSTGDEWIPEPYLYVVAYPFPDELLATALPEDAYWNTHGFKGAIRLYSALAGAQDPAQHALTFWREVLASGERLMGAGDF